MVTKHAYITWAGGYGDSLLGRCQQQGEAERQTQSKQVNFTPRKRKSCPRWDSNPRHCGLGERSIYQLSFQGNLSLQSGFLLPFLLL